MKKNINLGAETVAFVRNRMAEVLGENPDNIYSVEFDLKEVKDQIFHLFYDYQHKRQWPHVDANTAAIFGLERSTIWRLSKKKTSKKKNAALCNNNSVKKQ